MKTITFIIIILFFKFSLFAQTKPTEKETFDFICYFIENKVLDDVQDNLSVSKFKADKKNQIIEYEPSWVQASGSPDEFRITEKKIIDFKKIKTVEIKSFDNINYTGWSWKGSWRIYVTFKDNSVKVYTPKYGVNPPNIIYKDVRWSDREYEILNKNNISFYFSLNDESDAKKFYKAVNHFLNLKTGINTSLFDD